MESPPSPGRRRLLRGLAAASFALALGPLAGRAAAAAARERSLTLRHLHTGETLKATYFAEGSYQEDELRALAWLLRDWRAKRARAIDPLLLDLLWAVHHRLETARPIHIVCGYRTPETNAMLRRRSRAGGRAGGGVAKDSLHLKGMAIDLNVPGRSLRQLRAAALALRGGGVGYYPEADFVHLDTGRVRAW